MAVSGLRLEPGTFEIRVLNERWRKWRNEARWTEVTHLFVGMVTGRKKLLTLSDLSRLWHHPLKGVWRHRNSDRDTVPSRGGRVIVWCVNTEQIKWAGSTILCPQKQVWWVDSVPLNRYTSLYLPLLCWYECLSWSPLHGASGYRFGTATYGSGNRNRLYQETDWKAPSNITTTIHRTLATSSVQLTFKHRTSSI